MIKRIWNHTLGYFDGKAFWESFSSTLGAALGLLGLFVIPLLILVRLSGN
ncbi:hypothetical protein KKG45_10205 [bacterium]|nr:hypothetical protein [bacterium]MBU1675366.1 hypothetical protein [bacterium]